MNKHNPTKEQLEAVERMDIERKEVCKIINAKYQEKKRLKALNKQKK